MKPAQTPYDVLRGQVAELDNLAAFAAAAQVPLRTLARIKASTVPGAKPYVPTAGTLALLESAMARHHRAAKGPK